MKKQGDPDLSVTSPLIFDVLPFKKKHLSYVIFLRTGLVEISVIKIRIYVF